MKNVGENHFRILALRCFSPNNDYGELHAKVKCMQKALYGNEHWITFYEGVDVKDDDTIDLSSDFFDSQILYNDKAATTEISISAIVGENGSGKSSILDMIIRVMNNFAASIMGEKPLFPNAKHLHYINNVYASLMVLLGNEIKIINIEGGNVSMHRFVNGSGHTFRRDENHGHVEILKNYNSSDVLNKQAHNYWGLISSLFYSIVCNYSSYAYIYTDYLGEKTDEAKLKDINKDVNLGKDSQDAVWLSGLFHKNDGYQTPIVLNPMRQEGHIDSVKEQGLAVERLLSMLYYRNSNYNKDNSNIDEFPFRRINSVLRITGLYLTFEESYKTSADSGIVVIEELGLSDINIDYDECHKEILDFFDLEFGIRHSKAKYADQARSYLVYKVLKIASTYDQYIDLRYALPTQTEKHLGAIAIWLKRLIEDPSHITVKLRRVIAYLKWHIYDEYVDTNMPFEIGELDNSISEKMTKQLLFHEQSESNLMPPPIFRVAFKIEKEENIDDEDKYTPVLKAKKRWVMSSGEQQIANIISNVVYHLVNINSVFENKEPSKRRGHSRLLYNYVNIVFDEIELYFHPNLQREFLSHIENAIHNVTLSHIKGVNIMIATHSPFILSDLPKANILMLENGKGEHPADETFCANIHDMLKQSFFMDYSMGEIARNKVEWLFEVCRRVLEKQENIKLEKNDVCQLEYIASHIGDKYLKRKAEEKVKSLKLCTMNNAELEERRRSLERELDDIKKRLAEKYRDEKD